MLSLMIAIQYIGIAILFVEIFYVLKQKHSDLQVLVLVVVLSTLIQFVGYLFEIQADTKELALQAVKFIYVGKPYIALASFLFILKYYKIELPQWLSKILGTIHTSVILLVLTCEHHSLFYKNIRFVQDGLFPHLEKGHGVLYNLYITIVCMYLIVLMVIGVKRCRLATTKKERQMNFLLLGISGAPLVAIVFWFSGITKGYDVTVIAYLIGTIFLLILLLHYKLLDTVEIAKEYAIDEISQGMIVLDQHFKLIYTNHQVCDVFPEFTNGTYADILNRIEEHAKTGKYLFLKEKVYNIHQKDIIQDGMVYGKMLLIDNITDSYRYTIELEKQTALANKANKAKSEFLAKMSHEIRTPINAVLGMNEMILREGHEKQIKKYAIDIKKAANSLLELINDILDSSKIESGKLKILQVSYDLDVLLNDIHSMILIKAKDKNLKFFIEVDEKIPNHLFGDDVRLRQILINLLNNAIKYTEEGSVTLRITGVSDGEEVSLRFEVEDTGIGIKEEDLPKLYAAFERIEESKNRNIEGTGLGMSIVVEILNLMDSKLLVESRYGIGSIFYFDLKQGITKEGRIGKFDTSQMEVVNSDDENSLFLAPDAKVMVVDDNAINRKVFCNLLKRTQIQVTDVESGFKCLERVQKEHYDLIFMDSMMPEMDGIQTLRKLQSLKDNKCKGVPVIVLTADAVTGAKEHYLSKGFDDFLSKPVTGVVLENMIWKYLPSELLQEVHEGEL